MMMKWADDFIRGGKNRVKEYNSMHQSVSALRPNLDSDDKTDEFLKLPGPNDVLIMFHRRIDASSVNLAICEGFASSMRWQQVQTMAVFSIKGKWIIEHFPDLKDVFYQPLDSDRRLYIDFDIQDLTPVLDGKKNHAGIDWTVQSWGTGTEGRKAVSRAMLGHEGRRMGVVLPSAMKAYTKSKANTQGRNALHWGIEMANIDEEDREAQTDKEHEASTSGQEARTTAMMMKRADEFIKGGRDRVKEFNSIHQPASALYPNLDSGKEIDEVMKRAGPNDVLIMLHRGNDASRA